MLGFWAQSTVIEHSWEGHTEMRNSVDLYVYRNRICDGHMKRIRSILQVETCNTQHSSFYSVF